ncbi:MAG: aminopeptidase P family protein [Alphaproteobacteria bacterium]|nr:aminopeptidase P family protein [Alphaproteobacteria bacterium]
MSTHGSRLEALRKELRRQRLDGFVVPISDEHMSEYVGAYAQRLAWLTDFGGSAGTAVVLTDAMREPAAAMFVDGRYTLQVRDQVDGALWTYESVPETNVARWLGEHAPQGARIGYDPWLHGKRWVKAAQEALATRGSELVAVDANPVDTVWADRPAPSPAPALVHDEAHAGRSSADKRAELAQWLDKKKLDAAVICALDSLAWLFNVRGSDIERTPVVLANAIVYTGGQADLFIESGKVTPELRAHLGNAVTLRTASDFAGALAALASKRVAADPDSCVAAVFDLLEEAGAEVIEKTDPCALPKAIKNEAEQAGHRAAQARDGAALSRFLHWLSVEAPLGGVTEMAAADKLQAFREATDMLRDLSFDTISGSGPNGAIVHYRVSEETNRLLEPDSVFLLDSGGQYPDGTTDVTRTVWIAGADEPPAEVKDRFTRVLKGHIALAQTVFPKGTKGSQLDVLARQHLWRGGVDYAHGTGHGVGSFLSVHEGPQRIAKTCGAQSGGEQELLPGMILSNEPGYYKTGGYGIRIENLLLVEPRTIEGSEGEWFGFETLTLSPIERRLVDWSLMTAEEIAWWNAYHARVLAVIGPQLEGEARVWLEARCAPVS